MCIVTYILFKVIPCTKYESKRIWRCSLPTDIIVFLNYLWIEFLGVLFTASIQHILINLTLSLVLLQSKRYNNTLSKFRFNLTSPWLSCMKTKHHFSFSFVQSHVSSYKSSGPTHFFLFHLNQATKKNIKLLHCIKPRLSGLQPTSTSLHIPSFTPIKQKY